MITTYIKSADALGQLTRISRLLLTLACAIAIGGCEAETTTAKLQYPNRPIKVVVPFSAGGGTDTFARIIQHAIDEANLLPQQLVIINVPGASGTIGSRQVLHARPDGYTILCLHEAILTAKFSGKVAYGPEAFEPIAGTGSCPLIICVGEESKFQSLQDLMSAAAATPDEIVFSANIGAPSQFAGLMLEKELPGAFFRYTQTGGGAKRFAALKGGHVDVSAFSLAEYTQFEPAGLRALAICTEQRHSDAPDIPTAKEQGFDCISENTQFWWAPKGTQADRIASVAHAIEQAMRQPTVISQLATSKTDPIFIGGEHLREDLNRRSLRLQSVSQRPTTSLPNIPAIVGICVVALAITSLMQWQKSRTSPRGSNNTIPIRHDRAISLCASSILVVLYVASMQNHWIGFRPATASFLALMGLLLLRMEARRFPAKTIASFLAFSIAFTFGLHFLFTRLLVLDLP